MPEPDRPDDPETLDYVLRVEELCDRYEDELRAGRAVTPTEFLRGARVDASAAPTDLLRELAKLWDAYPPDTDARAGEPPAPVRPTDAETATQSLPPPDDSKATRAERGEGVGPTVRYFGDYELLGEIARGGMGVVYRARQVSLDRLVALKMIRSGEFAGPAEERRFRQEVEAVAALDHPHVVPVYEVGEHRGHQYYSMRLLEGGTLDQRAGGLAVPGASGSEARRRQRVIAALVRTVARAVHHAHQRGVLHRDLKPSNILLDEAGAPHVADFGLARRVGADSSLTTTGAVLGTPSYMAPEQARGARGVTTLADVYGLGAILYHLLTGHPPFRGTDVLDTLRLVRETEPARPRAVCRAVDRELETICLQCLAKDPARRYSSADALADDLDRFLEGRPIRARPVGPVERAWRWCRRNPTAAGLVAATGALVVVVVTGLVGYARQQEANATEQRALRQAADDAATRERDEAKRADREATEARKGRAAAERLADANEFFGLRNRIRAHATARAAGWTRETRADLARAVPLAARVPDAVLDLRGAAAGALLSSDLFPLEPMPLGFAVGSATTDPKSGLVAVGDLKGWGTFRVRLFDPVGGRVVRELTCRGGPIQADKQDGVRSLAFSPEGRRVFVGTRGSRVLRFDLDRADGLAAEWKAATDPVTELAVAPDGRTVYGRCESAGKVFAWAADTGAPLRDRAPPAGAHVRAFTVLPSGDVVGSTGRHLHRWTADGDLVQSVEVAGGDRLWAAPGRILLVAQGPGLAVYDTATLEPTNRLVDPALRLAAHEGVVRAAAVCPSGEFVATVADNDRAARVWELASGRLVGAIPVPGIGQPAVAWSGAHLVLAANGPVARWRFTPAAAQRFVCLSATPLEAAAFAGDRVVAVGEVRGGQRELFIGEPGAPAAAVHFDDPGRGPVHAAAAPDGSLGVTTGVPTVRLWTPEAWLADVQAWRAARFVPDRAVRNWTAAQFAPDGQTLWAIGEVEVRAFNPATLAARGRWNNSLRDVLTRGGELTALAVGRRLVVIGDAFGDVFLLDAARVTVLGRLPRPDDPILAVGVSPDDGVAIAGTRSGKLRAVRIADTAELPAVEAHPGGVTAIAFSRDGSLVATGGRDRSVRLWRCDRGRLEPLLAVTALTGPVGQLQFGLADNRLLVVLGRDHAARVWDTDRLNAQLAEMGLGW
jgi:eukaryotic-like serine/threonine-protein kinase